MIFRRELHKIYKKAFVPPPKISAKSYTIYEMKVDGNEDSGKILATINGKNSQEIASLTKIMTCIVVL
jgi:D-alanyl-D-alanine carboxypeptidase